MNTPALQHSKTPKPLFILGIGSTAFEIRRSALALERWDKVVCVAPEGEETVPDGAIPFEEFNSAQSGDYIFGMTRYDVKERWGMSEERMKDEGLVPASVIDKGALVFDTALVGVGTYLAAGVVVSHLAKVGDHCIVNFNVVVGHDVTIGNHVAINPNASIGGYAQIGDRTLIGANSFVFQGKKIGSGCKIDALTYVDRDIEDNKMVTGRGELKIYPSR